MSNFAIAGMALMAWVTPRACSWFCDYYETNQDHYINKKPQNPSDVLGKVSYYFFAGQRFRCIHHANYSPVLAYWHASLYDSLWLSILSLLFLKCCMNLNYNMIFPHPLVGIILTLASSMLIEAVRMVAEYAFDLPPYFLTTFRDHALDNVCNRPDQEHGVVAPERKNKSRNFFLSNINININTFSGESNETTLKIIGAILVLILSMFPIVDLALMIYYPVALAYNLSPCKSTHMNPTRAPQQLNVPHDHQSMYMGASAPPPSSTKHLLPAGA